MDFKDWIWDKFTDWRGKTDRGITEFAIYLDVKQPTLSNWIKGGSGPRGENLAKLGKKFPDVYEVLGFVVVNDGDVTSDQFSPEDREAFLEALRAAGLPVKSDADFDRALSAFEAHGIKVIRKR